MYKGIYMGEPVALKELKDAEVTPELSDQSIVNLERETKRLTYEEFRHEVWIMR